MAIVHTTMSKTITENGGIPKTLSRVERFENNAFWKRHFLVWMKKTMLSENGYINKIDTTGLKITWLWLSKMADRRYHVASISRQFRGPILYIKMRICRVHLSMRTEGIKAFSKRIRHCSVDRRKGYENDKCGCKSFRKRSKKAPFSFENGLVWTGLKKETKTIKKEK